MNRNRLNEISFGKLQERVDRLYGKKILVMNIDDTKLDIMADLIERVEVLEARMKVIEAVYSKNLTQK